MIQRLPIADSGGPRTFPGGNVRAVVFDLGGVLLRLRDPIENYELEITEAEFLELWLKSPSVREFERGAIDAPSFAESIVRELALPMNWRRFLERFNAWPEMLFADTLQLLDTVPCGVPAFNGLAGPRHRLRTRHAACRLRRTRARCSGPGQRRCTRRSR